jgi:uncharacterized protein (TIGR03437 family)
VLLTLNTGSVNLNADGVNRTDRDFALVWIRKYGQGRVFYSAFGHFDESFRLPVFRTMLQNALLWLTGEIEADATPRSGPSAPAPQFTSAGVTNIGGPAGVFAPGAIVEIAGDRLTSGSSFAASTAPLPARLAGTHVEVNGQTAPLYSVSPSKLMVQLPATLAPAADAALTVSSVNRASSPVSIRIEAAAPGILAVDRAGNVLVIYATGLGPADPPVEAGGASPVSPPATLRTPPAVRVGNQTAVVQFAGMAPGLVGVCQVNAAIPSGIAGDTDVILESGGRQSTPMPVRF